MATSSRKSSRSRMPFMKKFTSKNTDELMSVEIELEYLQYFKQDEFNLYKKAFVEQDKGSDGGIRASKFAIAVRNVGKNLTDSEIQEIFNENDIEEINDDVISFQLFLDILLKMSFDVDEVENELKLVFQVFDPRCKGYVHTQELAKLLEQVDESLTADEQTEIMNEIISLESEKGKLNYEGFVQLLA